MARLFGSKKTQARADLEAAELVLKQRERELEDAGAAFAQAGAEREAALTADDATLDRLDEAVHRRKILRDRAAERLEAARQSLERAREAADNEAREEASAKALAAHTAALKGYARGYASTARAMLQLWREAALADLACRQASVSVTVDGEGRRKEWLRPVEIERKRVRLWTDLRGTPLEPQPRDAEIRPGPNGQTVLPKPNASADFPVEKREFDRVTFRPDHGQWRAPLHLARTTALPGIGSGDRAIWGPDNYHGDPDLMIRAIEEALARIDAQLSALNTKADNRPIETRLEPVAAEDPDAGPFDHLETEGDEEDETEDESDLA